MSDCIEKTEGKGFSESREAGGAEKPYTLPSWRVSEIILIAVKFLSDQGYWDDSFDYQKAVIGEGIVIKAYSAFKRENLAELQKVSLSLWDEGLCLVATDKETGKVCRMIAYNDDRTAAEIMQIIFHEFAHIKFGHTEQSQHGEAEAILFSAITVFLMIAEQQFHIGRLIARDGGAKRLYEGMRAGLMDKFGGQTEVI